MHTLNGPCSKTWFPWTVLVFLIALLRFFMERYTPVSAISRDSTSSLSPSNSGNGSPTRKSTPPALQRAILITPQRRNIPVALHQGPRALRRPLGFPVTDGHSWRAQSADADKSRYLSFYSIDECMSNRTKVQPIVGPGTILRALQKTKNEVRVPHTPRAATTGDTRVGSTTS